MKYIILIIFALHTSLSFGQNLKAISKAYLDKNFELLERNADLDQNFEYHFENKLLREEYNLDYLRYSFDPNNDYTSVLHIYRNIQKYPTFEFNEFRLQGRNFEYGLKPRSKKINYPSDVISLYEGYFEQAFLSDFIKPKDQIVNLFLKDIEEEIKNSSGKIRVIRHNSNSESLEKWMNSGDAKLFFSIIVENSFNLLTNFIEDEVNKNEEEIVFIEKFHSMDGHLLHSLMDADIEKHLVGIESEFTNDDYLGLVYNLWDGLLFNDEISSSLREAIITYRVSTMWNLYKSIPKNFQLNNLPTYYKFGENLDLFIELPRYFDIHTTPRWSVPTFWIHYEININDNNNIEVLTTAEVNGITTNEFMNFVDSKLYFSNRPRTDEKSFLLKPNNGHLYIEVGLTESVIRDFILDTGANISMITEEDFNFLQYLENVTDIIETEVELASGTKKLKQVTLDLIKVGEQTINDIDVIVGDSRLLGTDILNLLGNWKIENGKLLID